MSRTLRADRPLPGRGGRLTQASYGAAQKVFYGYDGANNLDIYTVITNAEYLESFLLQFSMLEPFWPGLPELLRPWRELLAKAHG